LLKNGQKGLRLAQWYQIKLDFEDLIIKKVTKSTAILKINEEFGLWFWFIIKIKFKNLIINLYALIP